MRSKFQRITLCFMVFLLSACGFSFLYPRADFFISWQVDSYFSLTSQQERWLDERLEERLKWHHRSELPRWRAWLGRFREDIANHQMDERRYQEHIAAMVLLSKETGLGVVDDAVVLLSQLSDEQVVEFIEEFDEQVADEKETLAETPFEKYKKQRYKKTKKNLEDWFGSLDKIQLERVNTYVETSPDMCLEMIQSRERWNRYLEQMFKQRHDTAMIKAALQQMIQTPEFLRTPEYRDLWQAQGERRTTMLSFIFQTRSPQQHEHLLAALDEWLEDFDEVIKREL